MDDLYSMVYDAVTDAQVTFISEVPDKYDSCTYCGSPAFVMLQFKEASASYLWWSTCKWCFNVVNSMIGGREELLKYFWVKDVHPHPTINLEEVMSEVDNIVKGHKDS